MRLKHILAVCLSLAAMPAFADDGTITLFSAKGVATAYVAIDDELTIYLWSGQPVAYLTRGQSGSFNVYGFNGDHLGWLKEGVIWDHDGYAACATKDRINNAKYEPYMAFRKFKPFKSFEKFEPFQPFLRDEFGMDCAILLGSGGK